MRSPETAKAFMLRAVATDPPDLVLRDDLLTLEDLGSDDRAYLDTLGAVAGPAAAPAPEGDPLTLAEVAVSVSDFDRAFALARSAPSSPARARLLCECAFELGTLDTRSAAIAAVSGLGDAERSAFLARRVHRQLWETLQEEASPGTVEGADSEPMPTDWCSWLDHLDRHEGRKSSREIARIGAGEWSVADFLGQSGAADRFAMQLGGSWSQATEHVLRDCLPHLLLFFQKDPAWPNPLLKVIYRHLLDLLFFSTEGGRPDLVVWNELLDAALTLGIAGADDYGELVAYLKDLLTKFVAPTTLDWAIDALGLLVAHPCADAAARRTVFVAILDRAATFLRHIEPEQRDLLRLSAADLKETELFDQYIPPAPQAGPAEAEDRLATLGSLSVAVYTLTESAGKQFKVVLEARALGVRVSLCHDLVASSRLKQLARQADLFVVATGSATHAATACIEAHRPETMPTLKPSGKGAASMLRAIREHLALQ